ncbi:hypothetical protein ACEPPN_010217 [Leptodophora sp. 'Broadleaf-Isolate-01']
MKKGLESRVDELEKELSEFKADKKTQIEALEKDLSQLRGNTSSASNYKLENQSYRR